MTDQPTDGNKSAYTGIGIGAVPQTFYGKTPPEDVMKIYKKWFSIHSNEMINQAEYLNLYDMHFDVPENHVFKKSDSPGDVYYFSFYPNGSQWTGVIQFRGLQKNKTYTVCDYIKDITPGNFSGSSPFMKLSFEKYLLVKCTEK